MSKITRRLVLGAGGLAGVAAIAYGGGLVACRFVNRTTPDFFVTLPGLDRDVVARAGSRVLRAHREFAAHDTTERLLAAKPNIEEAGRATCIDTQLALVQDQCRQDFADGRVVVVDGWVLSETEAALSAHAVNA